MSKSIGLGLLVLSLAAATHAQSASDLAPPEATNTFHLGIYADAGYDSGRGGENDAFNLGGVDLYATSHLSDRWSALAELVFENLDGELVVDLERIQVSWDYSDALRVTAGRVHNPLIRWNVTQHHGLYVQTTIDKPAISNWEDEPGLWPVHLVGVSVSGRAPGLAGLSYYAAVANGRGTSLDEIQMSADANGSKALVASVTFAPAMLRGAELGGAWYRDRIPAPDGEIRESDYTLSFVYERNNVEVRTEWARMTHTPVATSIDHRTSGWYVLGAWSPPGVHSNIKPYVLLDRLDVDKGETYLENAPDVSAWAAGVRWDVSRHVALKTDYRSERLGDDERSGAVRIQLALSFQ